MLLFFNFKGSALLKKNRIYKNKAPSWNHKPSVSLGGHRILDCKSMNPGINLKPKSIVLGLKMQTKEEYMNVNSFSVRVLNYNV